MGFKRTLKFAEVVLCTFAADEDKTRDSNAVEQPSAVQISMKTDHIHYDDFLFLRILCKICFQGIHAHKQIKTEVEKATNLYRKLCRGSFQAHHGRAWKGRSPRT
jgi:hypothetical protein